MSHKDPLDALDATMKGLRTDNDVFRGATLLLPADSRQIHLVVLRRMPALISLPFCGLFK